MSGSISQSLGIVTVIWGGNTYNVDAKSTTFMPGGPVYKPVKNGNQISMALDSVTESSVKVSLALMKGQTVVGLKALNGSELQVETDSGQTWVIDSAYITKDTPVKGGAGNNLSIEWSGNPATEAIAQ